MIENNVPVVTIDGPGGSGKGTLASLLACELGWHLLDSGALYRLTALAAVNHGVSLDDEASLKVLAAHLDVQFLTGVDASREGGIVLEGEHVENAIRTEEVGAWASKIATLPDVRGALLTRQRAFAEMPGLVADGRDMGTVVFDGANIKFFLTASMEARAQRRFAQLQAQGVGVSLGRLLSDIKARDEQDSNRLIAPLRPADDAIVIDSTKLTVKEVLDRVLTTMRSNAVI